VNELNASLSGPSTPFRPMSFSEVLNRVGTILSRHGRVLLKLGAIPAAVLLATYALVLGGLLAFGLPPHPGHVPDPQRMTRVFFPLVLVAYLPLAVGFALFEAAVVKAALAANRGGASSFREAYGAAWARAGRIVWLVILRYLCVALPIAMLLGVIALIIQFSILSGKSNLEPGMLLVLMPLFVVGYAGSIVYAVWMILRLGLAVPACLTEEITALQSLKRSTRLTRGIMGRMFLVMLVVYAINFAVILVLEMIGFVVVAMVAVIGSSLHMHLTQPLGLVGIGILAIAVFAALLLVTTLGWASYVTTFCVFYDDQRLRLEGAAPALAGGGGS
jgi:hypothetical protein